MKYDRNLTVTLNNAIAELDKAISTQLSAIMQAEKFTKLEGSWRGLHYLAKNSETSVNLKIRVLNASKRELSKDLAKAVEFDQSRLFKSIYEDEFGTPGGEPWARSSAISNSTTVSRMCSCCKAFPRLRRPPSHPSSRQPAPACSASRTSANCRAPRSREDFRNGGICQVRSFRESDDSRFVTLALPRVLARMPYGPKTNPIDEFAFDETSGSITGELPHDNYCWMNAAYVMGTRLTDAFARSGWCTAIRGAENGGKVENLPMHVFASDDGDLDLKCPTEVASPTVAMPNSASSASCRSAITRTPITPCSSGADHAQAEDL